MAEEESESELRHRKPLIPTDETYIEESSKKKPTVKYESLPKPLVLQYLIILRIINALTINTFFQPDEYFQALEPAHNLAFGYGELTWEWVNQLRSFNYPFIFYLNYLLSDFLNFGQIGVLFLPKITQGIISAISEYYLYCFVQKIFPQNELFSRTVLLLSILSTFNWFCFTRTFSNTFELNLTIIALNYWPWDYFENKKQIDFKKMSLSLFFASLAILTRPTNILIWIVLGLHMLISVPEFVMKFRIIKLAILIGSFGILINVCLDYLYYEKLVFPLTKFFKFNVINSFADFYGINTWHFHLTQSIPFILTTYLPFFIYGLIFTENFQFKKLFLVIVGFNVLILSLISHKEFRFLYQLMPFFLIFTADGFLKFYKYANLSNSLLQKSSKILIYCLILINFGISLFLTQFQEKGVIDVIEYLSVNPDVDSIGFLTPCHSTPLHSYLHRRDLSFNIWYLTCEPPNESLVDYKDESDKFYENPKLYLDINLPPVNKKFQEKNRVYNYNWPTHLVFFEALEPFMKTYLDNSNYEECDRFFNSYFHWDSRRNGDVIIYCKWPWE